MGVEKIDPSWHPLIRRLLDARAVTPANLAQVLGCSVSRLTQIRNQMTNVKTDDGWAVRKREG